MSSKRKEKSSASLIIEGNASLLHEATDRKCHMLRLEFLSRARSLSLALSFYSKAADLVTLPALEILTLYHLC
jgi:hypothetical protein